MKDFTDIVFILDASGSMSHLVDDVRGSVNSFIDEQKKIGGNFSVKLYAFNNHLYEISNMDEYRVGGMTALIDSAYKVIDKTGIRLSSLPERDRPDKVIVLIITDGQENCSKEFTNSDLKTRIELQQNVYKWKFIFSGANQDSFAEAKKYGIPQHSTYNYEASTSGTRGLFASLTNVVKSYRSDK